MSCTLPQETPLRTLTSSQFLLPLGGSVLVRQHASSCMFAACECLPPEDKVEPARGAEYRCNPIPPRTYPPVPPEYLLHLFEHPEACHELDTWILNQLPKRISGELYGKPGEPAEGWGLYIQEGVDYDKITCIIALIVIVGVFGSLCFAVAWTIANHDVQGAFTVSLYVVALAGIYISILVLVNTWPSI